MLPISKRRYKMKSSARSRPISQLFVAKSNINVLSIIFYREAFLAEVIYNIPITEEFLTVSELKSQNFQQKLRKIEEWNIFSKDSAKIKKTYLFSRSHRFWKGKKILGARSYLLSLAVVSQSSHKKIQKGLGCHNIKHTFLIVSDSVRHVF